MKTVSKSEQKLKIIEARKRREIIRKSLPTPDEILERKLKREQNNLNRIL